MVGNVVRNVGFLSPPVHSARWAHMRHFMSVLPYGLDQKSDWIIIHISESKVDDWAGEEDNMLLGVVHHYHHFRL